jgi:hypothetical protein
MKNSYRIIGLTIAVAMAFACKQEDIGTQNAPYAGSQNSIWQQQGGFTPDGIGSAVLPTQSLSGISGAFSQLRIRTVSDTPSANISALFDQNLQNNLSADLGGFQLHQDILLYNWQATEKEGSVSLTIQVSDRLDPSLKYSVQVVPGTSSGAMQLSLQDPETIQGLTFSDTVTITAPAFSGTIDNISLSFRDLTTCWTRHGQQCIDSTPLDGDIIALVSLNVVADQSRYVIEQHERALQQEKFGNTLKVVRGITGILGGGLGGLFGR